MGGIQTGLTDAQLLASQLKAHELAGMNSSASEIDGNIVNTKKKKIAFLGDSITAESYISTVGYRAKGFITWVNLFMNNKFNFNIFGYSGYTTEQILAQISNVITYKPDICIVFAGANDIKQTYDISEVTSKYVEIISTLKSNNIRPIFISVIPRNDATEIQNLRALSFNEFLKSLSEQGEIDFINIRNRLIKNDFTLDSTKTNDGIHMSEVGAFDFALEVSTYLVNIIPSYVSIDNSVFDNLYPNKFLEGTAGTKTGNITGIIPDGIVAQGYGTNYTVIGSIGTIGDNYSTNAFYAECSSTVNDARFHLYESATLGIGDYYFEFECEFDDNFPLVLANARMQSFGAATYLTNSSAQIDTFNSLKKINTKFNKFTCRTPIINNPISQTVNFYSEIRFGMGSGIVKIYNHKIVKV